MNDDKERAAREADAHERAASSARNPEKRREHMLAALMLREQYQLLQPVSFGREGRDHAAERAEQTLINQWKETR